MQARLEMTRWWSSLRNHNWSAWSIAAHNNGEVEKLNFDLKYANNDTPELSRLLISNLDCDTHFPSFDKYDPEWIEALEKITETVTWSRSCRGRKPMTRLNLSLPCVSSGKSCMICGNEIRGEYFIVPDFTEYEVRVLRWLGGSFDNCLLKHIT